MTSVTGHVTEPIESTAWYSNTHAQDRQRAALSAITDKLQAAEDAWLDAYMAIMDDGATPAHVTVFYAAEGEVNELTAERDRLKASL